MVNVEETEKDKENVTIFAVVPTTGAEIFLAPRADLIAEPSSAGSWWNEYFRGESTSEKKNEPYCSFSRYEKDHDATSAPVFLSEMRSQASDHRCHPRTWQ